MVPGNFPYIPCNCSFKRRVARTRPDSTVSKCFLVPWVLHTYAMDRDDASVQGLPVQGPVFEARDQFVGGGGDCATALGSNSLVCAYNACCEARGVIPHTRHVERLASVPDSLIGKRHPRQRLQFGAGGTGKWAVACLGQENRASHITRVLSQSVGTSRCRCSAGLFQPLVCERCPFQPFHSAAVGAPRGALCITWQLHPLSTAPKPLREQGHA